MRIMIVGLLTAMALGGWAAPASAKPTPAQKCSATKIKCIGVQFLSVMKCYAKAAQTGQALDTACKLKATDKAAACFTKATTKGGCNPTHADAAHLDMDIDEWTVDIAITDLPV